MKQIADRLEKKILGLLKKISQNFMNKINQEIFLEEIMLTKFALNLIESNLYCIEEIETIAQYLGFSYQHVDILTEKWNSSELGKSYAFISWCSLSYQIPFFQFSSNSMDLYLIPIPFLPIVLSFVKFYEEFLKSIFYFQSF